MSDQSPESLSTKLGLEFDFDKKDRIPLETQELDALDKNWRSLQCLLSNQNIVRVS